MEPEGGMPGCAAPPFYMLCCRRAVLQDGLARGVATAHSVVLCFFAGPLGLLSHLATCAVAAATTALQGRRAAAALAVEQ